MHANIIHMHRIKLNMHKIVLLQMVPHIMGENLLSAAGQIIVQSLGNCLNYYCTILHCLYNL